jgi:MoaA/NifB/PqqE/SkfB family radical SAM enzyme/GT2 family glycosyltransferase
VTDPLASVVVAVRADARVRRLLASLASQTAPRGSYEVIVVENGSADLADTDGADGITRYAHLERASSGAARNAGLGLARGQFLLLTDADCVARPGWIEHLTARLAAGDVAAAGGTIVKHQPGTRAQRHAITVVDGQRSLSYLPALHLPYVAGANAGFVTSALREAGGFDEELLSGNDVDACYRLGLRGHRVGLAPDAVIEHEDRATVTAHFRRFYTYAVYQVLLYAKYKHLSGKRYVLDAYPLRRALQAAASAPGCTAHLLRGDPGPASAAALQLIEAAGVLCGDISGAIRFRQPYLLRTCHHRQERSPAVSMPDRPPLVKSRERHLTRRGVLWLGLRCDVRCKFCYDEHVPAVQKGWLSLEDAIRALDKFRSYYGNEFVDFMGGEPTLHPAILDITAHAASIGLRPTVITHGMHLARPEQAAAFAQAGIHDFLVSVHGTGETARAIHGRGRDNAARQEQALDNLRALGVPFRFNVTMIRDNLTELEAIAALAASKGARVVNFLTFNPYFEWERDVEISFQARHSDIAPHLMRAIDICTAAGVEANVRYFPPCQLPGYEQHVYTGYQLPYDPHEWDYNSWYDTGYPGQPGEDWYYRASGRQRERHDYHEVSACGGCALRDVCDGFHAQYAARWGGSEAIPYPGPPVADPRHFIRHQDKYQYPPGEPGSGPGPSASSSTELAAPLGLTASGGAVARRKLPAGQ